MITHKFILNLSTDDQKRLALCRAIYHNHPKKVSAKLSFKSDFSEKDKWEIIYSSETSPAEFFNKYKMKSFAKINLHVCTRESDF